MLISGVRELSHFKEIENMNRIQQQLYRLSVAFIAAFIFVLAGGAVLEASAQEYVLYGTRGSQLSRLNTYTGGTLNRMIANLQPNERIIALDFRPSNGLLYGLGSTGRLYRIDTNDSFTSEGYPVVNATAISQTPISIPIDTYYEYDMDFNPVSDLIRVVRDDRTHFRIDPNTGQVPNNTADTSMYFPAGHPRAGSNEYVNTIAYNNNTAGVTQTTAYVFSRGTVSQEDGFQTLGVPNSGQPGPNSGQLFQSAYTRINTPYNGFRPRALDIPKGSNQYGLALLINYGTGFPTDRSVYVFDLAGGGTARIIHNSAFDDGLDTLAVSLAPVQPPLQPGQILISEFRYNGPNAAGQDPTGQGDEFVELYNNTDGPLNLEGYRLLFGRSGVPDIQTFYGDFVVPARGHFLFASSDFSLCSYSVGINYGGQCSPGARPDEGGEKTVLKGSQALPNNSRKSLNTNAPNSVNDEAYSYLQRDQSVTLALPTGRIGLIDSVAFTGNFIDYREGTPLSPAGIQGGTGTPQYSFVRRNDAMGRPIDTNDNRNDFVLVSNTGADVASAGIPTILGMPSPQGIGAPITTNGMAGSYIDPVVGSAAAPNRVRIGSGNSGSLKIRRRLTNNTGRTIHNVRLTIYDITTLGTPVAIAPQADLRAVTSTDESAQTSFGPVALRGTTLELGNMQSAGGGFNSSYSVLLPAGGLAPGASVDLQFQLNVVLNGRFRFFVNVDVN